MLTIKFKNRNINIKLYYVDVSTHPEDTRLEIISENPNNKIGGHEGVNITYQRIPERNFWPGIKEQVTDFVRKCDICLEQKIVRVKSMNPC